MKKTLVRTLSLLLAILMIGSVVVLSVSAVVDDVISVSIKVEPTQKDYYVGEAALNKNGLVLKVTYKKDDKQDSFDVFGTDPEVEYTGFDTTTKGIKHVTAKYGNQSATFDITVYEKAKEIEVTKDPTRKSYLVGESFDPKGMVIEAKLSDGTTKEIKEGFTYEPDAFDERGEKTVTVKYLGAETDKLKVNVYDVEKDKLPVAITKDPDKMEYLVRETFDPTGMELTVTFPDKTTTVIKDGFTWKFGDGENTQNSFNEKGKPTITVKYKGNNLPLKVKVYELDSIDVRIPPKKMRYIVGEAFDPTGMELCAIYVLDQATSKEVPIKDGYKYKYNFNKADSKSPVIFTYDNKEAKIEVQVVDVESIRIVDKPAKTSYNRYDRLNPYGMTLEVTWTDGKTETYKASELRVDNEYVKYDYDFSAGGIRPVYVSIRGHQDKFDAYVYVQGVRSVSISDVKMLFKTTTVLQPNIQADVGVTKDDLTIHYESDDPSIARVDPETGKVTAVCWGETEIHVTVIDAAGGVYTDSCKVTVRFTILGWILRSLFGWIENWK